MFKLAYLPSAELDILEAEAAGDGEGSSIHCVLGSTPQGTLKPSLFVKCLCDFSGVQEAAHLAIREQILCRLKDGALVPMEAYPDERETPGPGGRAGAVGS